MLIAGLVVLIGLFFWALVGPFGIKGWKVLHVAGVPALEVPFMDLRGVATWCDADAEGIDPAKIQTSIPMPDGSRQPNFLMNYPPVVLVLSQAGLGATSVGYFGIFLAVLYFISALFLMGRIDLSDGWVWALLLISPLSLLLVERANLDILVFALFVAALFLRRHPALAAFAIFIAGVFKLYPAAGLSAPAMQSGRAGKICAVVGVGLFCGYLAFLLPRLAAIGGSLSNQYRSCFGSDVACDILIGHGVMNVLTGRFASEVLQLLAAVLCLLSLAAGYFVSDGSKIRMLTRRAEFAFWLAGPMMLALFILSNQMDYKWTFYLFMVPAALELARVPQGHERHLARIWLLFLGLYSYWTFFSGEESLRNALWKQGVMWLVFMAASGLAGMMVRGVFSRTYSKQET